MTRQLAVRISHDQTRQTKTTSANARAAQRTATAISIAGAVLIGSIYLGLTPAEAAKTPCWKIRKWVADYGETSVAAYAKLQGYSDKDIARGKRCLK